MKKEYTACNNMVTIIYMENRTYNHQTGILWPGTEVKLWRACGAPLMTGKEKKTRICRACARSKP